MSCVEEKIVVVLRLPGEKKYLMFIQVAFRVTHRKYFVFMGLFFLGGGEGGGEGVGSKRSLKETRTTTKSCELLNNH